VDRTVKVLILFCFLFLLASCSNKDEEQRSAKIIDKLNSVELSVDMLRDRVNSLEKTMKVYAVNDGKLYQEIENLCILLKSALLMNQMQKEVNEK